MVSSVSSGEIRLSGLEIALCKYDRYVKFVRSVRISLSSSEPLTQSSAEMKFYLLFELRESYDKTNLQFQKLNF